MARKPTGRPSGRHPGSTNSVGPGVARSLTAARKYQEEVARNRALGVEFEDHDPEANEMLGIILSVARGGVTGRYLGFRLAAAARVLEEKRGKPLVRFKGTVDTLATLVAKSQVQSPDPTPFPRISNLPALSPSPTTDPTETSPVQTTLEVETPATSNGGRAGRSAPVLVPEPDPDPDDPDPDDSE